MPFSSRGAQGQEHRRMTTTPPQQQDAQAEPREGHRVEGCNGQPCTCDPSFGHRVSAPECPACVDDEPTRHRPPPQFSEFCSAHAAIRRIERLTRDLEAAQLEIGQRVTLQTVTKVRGEYRAELEAARQQNAHWRSEALTVLTRTEQERDDAHARLAAAQELAKAQDDLLVAYRTGSQRRGAAAVDKVRAARAKLAAFDAATVGQEQTETCPSCGEVSAKTLMCRSCTLEQHQHDQEQP